MARKHSLVTQLVNPATSTTTFSLASSFNSPATVVRFLDNCSYQINTFTTDSIGTFQVQVSDDYYVNEANDSVVMNPGTWTTLQLSGGPSVGGVNDSIVIDLRQLPFYAVRLAYTSTTAGTGTAQIYITDKSVGA